ncbi:MAG: adenine phosphoribosyltransferase [Myxococcota bacterium]
MGDLAADVSAKLRDIPDFPKPGVLFKDITPVLADPELFGRIIEWYAGLLQGVDKIVAIESRGFMFAGALVTRIGAGMVLARKKGKLPYETVSEDFDLEYGTATLELHTDSVLPGERVLIVDDLLATGGTARATVDLVRRLGGVVIGVAVVTELSFLNGRKKFDCPVYALVDI